MSYKPQGSIKSFIMATFNGNATKRNNNVVKSNTQKCELISIKGLMNYSKLVTEEGNVSGMFKAFKVENTSDFKKVIYFTLVTSPEDSKDAQFVLENINKSKNSKAYKEAKELQDIFESKDVFYTILDFSIVGKKDSYDTLSVLRNKYGKSQKFGRFLGNLEQLGQFVTSDLSKYANDLELVSNAYTDYAEAYKEAKAKGEKLPVEMGLIAVANMLTPVIANSTFQTRAYRGNVMLFSFLQAR